MGIIGNGTAEQNRAVMSEDSCTQHAQHALTGCEHTTRRSEGSMASQDELQYCMLGAWSHSPEDPDGEVVHRTSKGVRE